MARLGHLPMRVLHIITGLADGGAEGVLFRLVKHDQLDQHEVVSLTDAEKYGSKLKALGISVTCLNMPRGRLTLSGIWRLLRQIKKVRPDVVQTWMYHADLLGGVLARLAGCRNIVWGIRHTSLDSKLTSRRTIAVARLCAHLSRFIPRQIACCAEKSYEAHVALGYSARRMRVVSNGYDQSLFCPDPDAGRNLRATLNLDVSETVIGFVARYEPIKDHASLLNALALLRERGRKLVCLLVGTDMDRENAELTEMIADLGMTDQVHLLGQRNDIPAVMNALDLHVMSSASEGFPNVLAEAMACGTPCVTTDVGDAAAILGGTGRVVQPRDSTALADAIVGLLAERGTSGWDARCDAARQHIVAHFSIEKMVSSYRNIWSDAQKS